MATINTTDPKPGYVYDTDTDTWYPLLGLATQSLDGLTDVVITTPATNQVLAYNGTNWVNSSEAGDVSAVTAGTGITVTDSTGPIPSVAIDTTVTADLTTAQTLTNKTLTSPVLGGTTTTASGNLVLDPATNVVEVYGDGTSVVGQIQLNCHVNSHGQIIASQPHSESATNTLLLPGGNTIGNANATLVSNTGTQTLTNKTLTAPIINLELNAQTGTTYTFVSTDSGKLVTASTSATQTYSIPTNATTAFPVGTQINIIQIGAGQVTINAVTPGTTTIGSTGATSTAPKLRAQYSAATCIKAGTDLWYVVGDIS